MSTTELYIIVCGISAVIGGTIGYVRKKRQIRKQQEEWVKTKMLLVAISSTGDSEYQALVTSVGREKANDIVLMNWKLRNGYFGV